MAPSTAPPDPTATTRRPRKPEPISTRSVNISVAVAVVVCAWAMWMGNVGTLIDDAPLLWKSVTSTVMSAIVEPELTPYKCLTTDGSEDFKMMVEGLAQGGANVEGVGLGTFDGVRGLQALRHVPKGEAVLSMPYSYALSIATIASSENAGQAASNFQYVPDGDMHFDTLALLYEAHVKGEKSPWKRYFCTLPKEYDLPLTYTDAWSKEVVAALPNLNRLVNKRRSQVAFFDEAVRGALQRLIGGSALLKNVSQAEFSRLHTWAYLAAKTRTVSWDLKEAAENNYKVPIAPSLSWLEEVGMMVPVLDMANHAGKDSATTMFTVDYSGNHLPKYLGGSASTADERPARANRNAEKQSAKSRSFPMFSLVALKDINPGDQITFPYLPEDDIQPQCNDRWLLEYGIVHHDGHPMHDCHTFNVTAADLVRVTQGPAEAKAEEGHVLQALKSARAGFWFTVRLIRSGNSKEPLVEDKEAYGLKLLLKWAETALHGDAKRAHEGVCVLVQEQAAQMEQKFSRIREMAAAMDGKDGEAAQQGVPSQRRQADLLQVLEGAVRAAKEAPKQLNCV